MLKDDLLLPPLSIAANLFPLYQNIVGFFPRKTECRPFAKALTTADIGRVAGFHSKFTVKDKEERCEDSECLFDRSGRGELVRGADDAVGQFVGMIDDAAAGDPPDGGDAGGVAPVEVKDLGCILKPPQRQGWRLPAVKAEERERCGRVEGEEERLVNGHVRRPIQRTGVDEAPMSW